MECKVCTYDVLFLHSFLFVHVRENSGEDCPADGMVGTADGARHDAESRFRVEGYVLWIGKECCREDSCHARVLHADFDRNGALLGCAELEQTSDAIAEHITESVVAEHDGEHKSQKSKAICQKVRTHSHDDSAHD